MAKDDYHYLVFRILTYLYGVFQCKYSFDEKVFLVTVDRTKDGISEEYLTRVLKFMTDDGLIEGLLFTKAWGTEYILGSDYKFMRITPKGLSYLSENSKMNELKKTLSESAGLITELVKLVFSL